MDKEPGHVYILINPSMEGLVKIGKTTKDPDFRAKELSQATGVPTPFYVAFSIQVADCDAAENYVFAILDYNGFKRTTNREFFEIPLRRAIEVLLLAEKELLKSVETDAALDNPSHSDADDEDVCKHPGADFMEKAVNAYLGLGDEIKDKKEAFRLLHKAKAFDVAPAYISLAEYLQRESFDAAANGDTEEARQLREQAFEVLREGATKGHGSCHVKMTRLYAGSDTFSMLSDREPENANKCWKKFFRSSTFINDEDLHWSGCSSLGTDSESGRSRVQYARDYLFEVFLEILPLDFDIREILMSLRAEVLESISRSIDYLSQQNRPDPLDSQLKFLNFVDSTLSIPKQKTAE